MKVFVESAGTAKRRRGHARTRVFSAELLAAVIADDLWENAVGWEDEWRPAYVLLGTSVEAARAVVANLRLGRGLVSNPSPGRGETIERFVFLRSLQHEFDVLELRSLPVTDLARNDANETQIQALRPDLLAEDPGGLDGILRAVVVNPSWWVHRERTAFAANAAGVRELHDFASYFRLGEPGAGRPVPADVVLAEAELLTLLPIAVRFYRSVLSRTRCPLLPAFTWALYLLLAALGEGVASLGVYGVGRWNKRLREESPDDRWAWARHGWANRCHDIGAHRTFNPPDEAAEVLYPSVFLLCEAADLERRLAGWTRDYSQAAERTT